MRLQNSPVHGGGIAGDRVAGGGERADRGEWRDGIAAEGTGRVAGGDRAIVARYRDAIADGPGGARSGGATRLGIAALPLKLLLFVALVYVVFARVHLDGLGFALGVLTQVTAIIIETGRTSLRKNRTDSGIPEEF